jgi:hypothetical protein
MCHVRVRYAWGYVTVPKVSQDLEAFERGREATSGVRQGRQCTYVRNYVSETKAENWKKGYRFEPTGTFRSSL